jgi:hypothetical protein
MKEYVHLKDGVVFAHHKTENDVDDSSDNVIEVTGDLDSYLNKKYENGTFVTAPELRYAILDGNTVVGIHKTFFSSDAGSNILISNPDVQILWTWNGTNFNPPINPALHDTITIDSVPVTTSAKMPALTAEELTTNYENSLEAKVAQVVIPDDPSSIS